MTVDGRAPASYRFTMARIVWHGMLFIQVQHHDPSQVQHWQVASE